jgi:hypothetical protein
MVAPLWLCIATEQCLGPCCRYGDAQAINTINMVGFGGLLVSHHTWHITQSAELVGAQATLTVVSRHVCVMSTRVSCNCVAMPQGIALQAPAHQHHDARSCNVVCSYHALSKHYNTTHKCRTPYAETQLQVPPKCHSRSLLHTAASMLCSASGSQCVGHFTWVLL